MALLKIKDREKLLVKARQQKEFGENYKQKRLTAWKLSEDLVNPDKRLDTLTDKDIAGTIIKRDTKADVPLFDLQAFRDTFLSKIKTPLSFKYTRGDLGDDRKAKLMNSLKERESKVGRWSYYDLLGKNDAITYGRAIYFFTTSYTQKGGFTSILKLIDPKDFIIDPEVGGICTPDGDSGQDSLDSARFMGWWNVKITRKELLDGMEAGIYYKDTTKKLLSNVAQAGTDTDQEMDKQNRKPVELNTGYVDEDMFTFYAWFLRNADDEKIYMIFDASGTTCIRAQKWSEIDRSDMFPVWTWAAYPNPREFWSPSPVDYYRGMSIAKQKSINQMMDNAERINDPPRAVNIDAIRNPTQVRARKSALIEIEGDMTAQNALQVVQTPVIDTPLAVYDKIDVIGQAMTGVTAGMRGDSQEEVVAVYEGNKEEAQDRLSLMSRSYSEGYYRMAVLFKEGVYQNLRKKYAVEILGSDGLDIEYIIRTDVRPTGRDYNILIESSNAEAQMNSTMMKNKIAFISANKGSQVVNQQVLVEEEAKLVGYDDTDIKRFLSTDDYEDIAIMSQAEEAFQFTINGKSVPPYKTINTSFVERVNDLWRSHGSELSDEQNAAVGSFLQFALGEARKNAAREAALQAEEDAINMRQQQIDQQAAQQQGMASAAKTPMKLSTEESGQNPEMSATM